MVNIDLISIKRLNLKFENLNFQWEDFRWFITGLIWISKNDSFKTSLLVNYKVGWICIILYPISNKPVF